MLHSLLLSSRNFSKMPVILPMSVWIQLSFPFRLSWILVFPLVTVHAFVAGWCIDVISCSVNTIVALFSTSFVVDAIDPSNPYAPKVLVAPSCHRSPSPVVCDVCPAVRVRASLQETRAAGNFLTVWFVGSCVFSNDNWIQIRKL